MRIASLSLALLLAAAGAEAAEPTRQQIDEMTDAVVALLPMGRIMEDAAAADPEWPVQGKANAVTPEQLACLRSELSMEGFRRFKRLDVVEHLSNDSRDFKSELQVLRQAAPLMSKIMMAGADAAKRKTELQPADLMRDADADQMMAMISLGRDPKFRNLRELTGIGDAMSGESSGSENETTGQMIAMKAMFHGMKACGVSPGVLL